MRDGRSTGLILMGLAVAAFLGSTSEVLPPVTFFPALALFAVGGVQFFLSSRVALAEAERQTQERLKPVIRENRSAQATAERRAMRRGAALDSVDSALADESATHRRPAGTAPASRTAPIELELEASAAAGELVVTQDVSFPVEVQRGDALADQLRKLNLLLTQGILTEEEYAIAKAKLLS